MRIEVLELVFPASRGFDDPDPQQRTDEDVAVLAKMGTYVASVAASLLNPPTIPVFAA